jgi:indoleacetate--lysine synthetase
MNVSQTTEFDIKNINNFLYHTDKLKAVVSYEDFITKIPICNRTAYIEKLNKVFEGKNLHGYIFTASSGTSASCLLTAKKGKIDSKYSEMSKANFYLIYKYLNLNKFDVVANLFTAGNFSTLYDGINRILEYIGCNILPVGNIANFQDKFKTLSLMCQLKVNVLFGTPSSIIYLIKLLQEYKLNLVIKSIVYTGEKLNESKRALLYSFWPQVKIFSLYGHSELGFLGINTPQCGLEKYHLIDSKILFAESINSKLFVTVIDDGIVVPIIRYEVGDNALIHSCCDCGYNGATLQFLQRYDLNFKFSGNLVSYNIINNIVRNHLSNLDYEMQIIISTDKNLFDVLDIRIALVTNCRGYDVSTIYNEIILFDDIKEAIDKKVGTVICSLVNYNELLISNNQKVTKLLDLR